MEVDELVEVAVLVEVLVVEIDVLVLPLVVVDDELMLTLVLVALPLVVVVVLIEVSVDPFKSVIVHLFPITLHPSSIVFPQ